MTVEILQIISEAHKATLLSDSQKQFGTIKLHYNLRGTVVLKKRTEIQRQRDGSLLWKNLNHTSYLKKIQLKPIKAEEIL